MSQELERVREKLGASAGLGLQVASNEEGIEILALFQSPDTVWELERSFGGAAPNAIQWAISLTLDHLRRELGRAAD
jgi:hypothetical protein